MTCPRFVPFEIVKVGPGEIRPTCPSLSEASEEEEEDEKEAGRLFIVPLGWRDPFLAELGEPGVELRLEFERRSFAFPLGCDFNTGSSFFTFSDDILHQGFLGASPLEADFSRFGTKRRASVLINLPLLRGSPSLSTSPAAIDLWYSICSWSMAACATPLRTSLTTFPLLLL